MKEVVPLIVLVVIFGGLILFSRRGRQRATQASQVRAEQMRPGLEVMTTSGLYGRVISVNQSDNSVQLAIAPGVEVKWTIPALREIPDLPAEYRDVIPPVAENRTIDGRA